MQRSKAWILMLGLCIVLLPMLAQSQKGRLQNANSERLLQYEIEGVSLSTPAANIEKILQARGYKRANPVILTPATTQYTEHFIKGDYISREYAKALVYQSAPNGFAFEMRVIVNKVNGKNQIDNILYSRLWRIDPRSDRSPGPPKPLPDTPDRKIIADLKEFVCSGFTDETERWQTCPPDTDKEIHWAGSVDKQFISTSGIMQVSFQAREKMAHARIAR